MQQAQNIGGDFIFGKLHARWSTALTGERLEELLRGNSLPALGRVLATLGVPIQDRSLVQKNLMLVAIRDLAQLASWLDADTALFYRRQIERFFLDNLKAILRCRHQAAETSELPFLLVESEHLPSLPWRSLLEARDEGEFRRRLPAVEFDEELDAIIGAAEQHRDRFVTEAQLDALYYRRLLAAAAGLSGSCRKLAVDLIGGEIDLTNLITAMRNLTLYHFSADQLLALALPGGRRLAPATVVKLGAAKDVGKLAALLPAEYARPLDANLNREPYVGENQLWCWLWRQAERAFKDYARPELAAVAYPLLRRFELLNLERLFEGLYLKLPPAIIRTMMVGELR